MSAIRGMVRGRVRPNHGHEQHLIADIAIPREGRDFVVDVQLEQLLINEEGKPLVLSARAYEAFLAEFGKALICEPLHDGDGVEAEERFRVELHAARERIHSLEQQLAVLAAERDTLKQQLAATEKKAK